MIKVHEIINLNNGMPVLICDLFQDDVITDKLSTNIGDFLKKDFSVGQIHYCFSKPKSRTILLRTMRDCTEIHSIKFV